MKTPYFNVQRKPVKTNPFIIMTKLSTKEKDLLNKKIYDNFRELADGKGNYSRWLDLLIRFHVALELAKQFYEQETIDGFQAIYYRLLSIKERCLMEDKWYLTDEDIDWIESGLEASNQVQDTTTRRLLLELHLKAKDFVEKTYIKPYLKEQQAKAA